MKRGIEKISASKIWWLLLLVILFVLNYLAAVFHIRLDLTKEKRYTLSKATSELLNNLDNDIQIDVFLKGQFPSGFKKLATSTDEFLRLMKERNSVKIHYRFISPENEIPGTKTLYGDSLVSLGAVPINLKVQKKAGENSNIIFPVAVIHYKNKSALVNLYPGASGRISQEEINSAEALMEYQFVKTLDKLTQSKKPGIAYSVGNGEPVDGRTYDLVQTLEKEYEFRILNIKEQPRIPDAVNILLIVKPKDPFTEEEKLKIDQFVMNGGKLICFIDNLIAEQDSLTNNKIETIAYDRNLNLTDLFFRYGLRINTDLVMDLQSDLIPFVVGGTQQNPQFEFLRWNYFPLLSPGNSKLVNKNMGYVSGKFVNSIDTIQVPGIKKTPILVSSANSRIIRTPALISLNENKNSPVDDNFKKNAIPVAVLLEGKFNSIYSNRIAKSQLDSLKANGAAFKEISAENKMIIVADGDIVLNDFVSGEGPDSQPTPIPMGWNKYTYSEYMKQTEAGKFFIPVANRDFVINCIDNLVNNPAISETRNKDIVLRLLDSKKVNGQKTTWQFVNIGLPIFLLLFFGWIYQQVRKRKYAV